MTEDQLIRFLKSHGGLSSKDIQSVIGYSRDLEKSKDAEIAELRNCIRGARTALRQQVNGIKSLITIVQGGNHG